jgi:uncharacterized protein YjcR
MDNITNEERNLILELYNKNRTHTEIAACIARERKIFKRNDSVTDALLDIEKVILDSYRRGAND